MTDIKKFDRNNITERPRLDDDWSLTRYRGHGAQQNPEAFEVFYNFLNDVKPKRILEIGTGIGGFIMSLKLFVDELELDTELRTYDINGSFMYNTLKENGIDNRLENIFYDDGTINPEVIDYIQQDGITLVLCDGGNKINEFRIFSQHIKVGDFIFAHDYAKDPDYFETHLNRKIWNWHEIHDSDIEPSVVEHNLESFMPDEFQKAVWVCKKKIILNKQ